MNRIYKKHTPASGAALCSLQISGEVIMLILLRFKDIADFSDYPKLKPPQEVSDRAAFQKYINHTMPFLQASGGEILLLAEGSSYFIGPEDEQWDLVMLIKQSSLTSYMAFASNEQYLLCIGHREAALADSRVLPLVEFNDNKITG